MPPHERLRQAIDQQQRHLRASVPGARQSAILAVIRALDRMPHSSPSERLPDLISGRRLDSSGGNMALQLALESNGDDAAPSVGSLDSWAERFLLECGWLAEAELVLTHAETGFMRIVDDGSGTFNAWIATRLAPASWLERADIDWWAALLARRHQPVQPEISLNPSGDDAYYRRLANAHLDMMAYQLGYPSDAVIDGCSIQTYRAVLSWLIGFALRARDRREPMMARAEESLLGAIASALRLDPAVAGRAVAAFTLDAENAAYHASVPGVAAAPLVRIEPGHLAWSVHGLTTEPLLFMTRELRRRAAQDYHNSAYLREDVFRHDLYALLPDKRFVTSSGRIELRRDSGNIRTDIDAVVFDRKTGTLAFFELKSQDPFARSAAELARQRNNLLYANRQISGVLAWLNRQGAADELLNRVDHRIARTFRVHKVHPFVLGRYLAHFPDGAEPDRRAAWGTWPQLLRLLDGQPARASDAHPLTSLFTRLKKDDPHTRAPAAGPPQTFDLGASRLIVHPSFAAYQTSLAGDGTT